MPITVTATFECANITEFDEVMSLVRDNEPIIIDVSGHVHFDYSDLTPPQGIERRSTEHALQLWANQLVAWTRREIKLGPIVDLSDMTLYQAFRRLADDDEADLGDLMPSPTHGSCVRGAFKDAQAGMVPL